MLNVRDFGARGDGIADDAHPIQAALDVAAVAGGTVFLPDGVYRAASYCHGAYVFAVSSNTRVLGEGDRTQLQIDVTTANTAVFQSGLPSLYRDQTVLAMAPASRGDQSITFVTPTDASSVTRGDFLFVRGGWNVPDSPTCELTVVESTDSVTGVVGLRFPLAHTYTNDGLTPFGAVNVTAQTVSRIAFEGFTLSSEIIPFAVSQIYKLAFSDLCVDVPESLLDVPTWTSGFLRGVRCERLALTNGSAASGEGIVQIANSVDWTWDDCDFATKGGACVQITEGSAQIQLRHSLFRGDGFIAGSASEDVEFSDCRMTLATATPGYHLFFGAGGVPVHRLTLRRNKMNLQGAVSGVSLVGDDVTFDGNDVICNSDNAAARAALSLGASATRASITNSRVRATNPSTTPMLTVTAEAHDFRVIGNDFRGQPEASGITVLDAGAQMVPFVVAGNILVNCPVTIQTPANEGAYVLAGNVSV